MSELDNVVSVSKKVNSLGVPLRALQAWDSDLITGEVVYLVLLMNFGSKYPVDPDNGVRDEVRYRVGISPKVCRADRVSCGADALPLTVQAFQDRHRCCVPLT